MDDRQRAVLALADECDRPGALAEDFDNRVFPAITEAGRFERIIFADRPGRPERWRDRVFDTTFIVRGMFSGSIDRTVQTVWRMAGGAPQCVPSDPRKNLAAALRALSQVKSDAWMYDGFSLWGRS